MKDLNKKQTFKRKNLYGALLLEVTALFLMGVNIGARDSLSLIFMLLFWVAGILVLYAGRLPKDDEIVKEQKQ